jgi:hypothetical protein
MYIPSLSTLFPIRGVGHTLTRYTALLKATSVDPCVLLVSGLARHATGALNYHFAMRIKPSFAVIACSARERGHNEEMFV